LAALVTQHGVAHAARTVLMGSVLAGTELARVATPSPAMTQLMEHHDDPRAVVALLMHHMRLHPGEALFLDSGTVHAYLHGVALEVQGSSDNVMRAAFTDKHVDLDEFFAIARLDDATSAGALDPTERVSPPPRHTAATRHFP
jgi:mannose-6-phosphate isomerase